MFDDRNDAVPMGRTLADAAYLAREQARQLETLRKRRAMVCLDAPWGFHAVGQFYRHFPQVEDEEVLALLR